jgi:hypothetical protein
MYAIIATACRREWQAMMHTDGYWRRSCRHALKKVHIRRRNDEVLYCIGFMSGECSQEQKNKKENQQTAATTNFHMDDLCKNLTDRNSGSEWLHYTHGR